MNMNSEDSGQAEPSSSEQSPSPPVQATYPTGSRNCVSCGRSINWDSNVCPYCGHDYRFIAAPIEPMKRSAKPLLGGILIMIAGMLSLAMAFSFIVIDVSDIESWDYQPLTDSGFTPVELEELLGVCGTIEIVIGTIAIIGGVFAIVRKYFVLAVIGGIFGLIGAGFIVGGLLGLIGLVLVIISRNEFGRNPTRQM